MPSHSTHSPAAIGQRALDAAIAAAWQQWSVLGASGDLRDLSNPLSAFGSTPVRPPDRSSTAGLSAGGDYAAAILRGARHWDLPEAWLGLLEAELR